MRRVPQLNVGFGSVLIWALGLALTVLGVMAGAARAVVVPLSEVFVAKARFVGAVRLNLIPVAHHSPDNDVQFAPKDTALIVGPRLWIKSNEIVLEFPKLPRSEQSYVLQFPDRVLRFPVRKFPVDMRGKASFDLNAVDNGGGSSVIGKHKIKLAFGDMDRSEVKVVDSFSYPGADPRAFSIYEGIGTGFSGAGTLPSSIRSRFRVADVFLKQCSLFRHLCYLLVHGPQLAKVQVNLTPHFGNLLVNSLQGANGYHDANDADNYQCAIGEVLREKQITEGGFRLLGMIVLLPLGCLLIYYYDRPSRRVYRIFAFGGGVSCVSIAMGLGFLPAYYQRCTNNGEANPFHSDKSVTQKCLTTLYFCNTVIRMANVLNTDKKIAVIGALAEGSSIRSIERITGVHRDTVMRLGVRVGKGCAALMDAKMRGLGCRYLEFDEIWGFIGKKEKNLTIDDGPECGDAWTFCAVDAETKLVPAFKVGKRDGATANAFVQDVANRMKNRVQISTDGLRAYVEAIESAFGKDVDYAQIVKTYIHDESGHPNRRYSAPDIVSTEKKWFAGRPDMRHVSTSYVERLNATTRLHMRRLTRLTLAFSKKRENFEAAVALHFAYYNFVKRHNTLRCTPAMAAGVERDFWSVGNLVEAAI